MKSYQKVSMRVIVGILLLFTFYFWPTSFALLRNSEKKMVVFLINFLLGWTIIGWIVALIKSLNSQTVNEKINL